MVNSGYSTDNSDTDQNNSYPLKEKSKLKRHTKRKNHRKRFGRMAKSWKFMKMKKLWERDLAKQRSISAPFVPIKANNKYESMTASLLFMFAVIQCIFGFVLPICDSFGMRGSKQYFEADHKYYLEIFLISQYCGAVLVLAYLQYLIYSGTKKQLRQTLINEICRSKNSCELVDDKHMIINEHHELSEPNIIISTDYANNSPPVSPYDKLSDIESTTSERQFTRLIHYYNDTNNQEKRYISIHPEGMNLYMRLGAVGFGLGVMIHDGFNLSSVWEVSEPVCHSKLWIPKHIIRIIWVLWQTYFVFKYHRVILHRHRVTVRLACIHLATINFCHWLKVVVGEVAHTLKAPVLYSSTFQSPHISNIQLDNHSKTHTSLRGYNRNHTQSNYNAVSNNTMTEITNRPDDGSIPKVCLGYLGVTLDPFLFPLAIEYSLITGSFFYKMLQRLDQTYPKSFNNASNGSECLELNSPSLLSPSPPSTANSMSKNEFDRLNNSLFLDDDVSEQQYRHQECTKHMTYRPVMGCKVFLPLLKQNKLPILNEYYTESIVEECKETTPTTNEHKLTKLNSGHQCHRSHTGLFLGIMLLIASIVCMVLFLLRGRNNSKQFTAFIYQKSKLALSSIGLFACIMAILQTNQLKFHRLKHGENFEYNLLTIGLIGCITYYMFLFIPALEIVIHFIIFHQINLNKHLNIEQFNNDLNEYTINILNKTNNNNNNNLLNDQHIQYTALLYLIKCTLEICQALLQFFFIVETSRRKVCCINQARIKPGRSIIVFLLICNLALWLINTFEVRSAETQLPLYRQYFGVRTWSVITYCFIPLIIFFRFHSTVCLAELWTKLYTLR